MNMIMCDAIGGYFGLEIQQRESYHKNLLALNSGRNALEYILRARRYKHIYIPYYTCDVLLEPLEKLNITYDFYTVNERLEPETLPAIKSGSGFLYTNYFGLKSNYIEKLSIMLPNLVVDAAQSFFYKPLSGIDTFYSPRKFFGVPDGGYVSCEIKLSGDFSEDISSDRFSHLLVRIDKNAEEGYADFKDNDAVLSHQPIKTMSKLTTALLNSMDYRTALNKRNENFRYLHSFLKEKNVLQWLDEDLMNGPMIYPFYFAGEGLRERLIEHKIYIARYWPNLCNWVGNEKFEHRLYKYLLPLPIDHRYGETEMKYILKRIHQFS